MQGKDNDFDAEEGARPSSLISVHKLSTPDPLYDLQLMRELEIINARTRAELGPRPHGGVPVQPKRKPMVESLGRDWLPTIAAEQTEEDETMKLRDVAMVTALGVLTAGSAFAAENSIDSDKVAVASQARATNQAKDKAKPKLDPEYKKIRTFSAFRKKIIGDGWVPLPNPECHDAVKGHCYDEVCREDPESIGCRVCTLVPELFRHTSDGYNLMRYTKDGVPLGVTVYGDIQDLDSPGQYGLEVVGWEYTEGLNVILIDE